MKMLIVTLVMVSLVAPSIAYEGAEHWNNLAREDIRKALMAKPNYNLAKNTILMVGDGLGISTVTAARILLGQKHNQLGEEYKLAFEDFPHIGLLKTYTLDRQVSDSAATAFAMVSGIKVNAGTLGVTADVPNVESCAEYSSDRTVQTILDFALAEGKSVGLVTNTRITHATPASTYAHTPWRNWEADKYMTGIEGCEAVKDVSYQLIMNNSNIQVMLGGGSRGFQNRPDGLDLIQEWKNDKSYRGRTHAFVDDRDDLMNVNPAETDYLFGLFAYSHMSYEVDRPDTNEPSLEEMTEKALQILKRNPKGYFLMIEGGRIDHAHHKNLGKKALEETIAFHDTVGKVREMTSTKDTLLVVTADHSHVFTISGHPSRGNDILGVADITIPGLEASDGKPYLTLGYANGPADFTRDFPVDTTGNDFQQPPCVPIPSETHSGEDVAVYAIGPMAQLFHTTHEQSYVAHVMMYAACLGPYKNDCDLDYRYKMLLDAGHQDGGHNIYDSAPSMTPCTTLLILAFAFLVFLRRL